MEEKTKQPMTARQKAILKKRKRRRRSFAFILMAVLIIGSLVAIYMLFFRISDIKVENSITSVYTGDQIIAASGLQKGDGIFSFKKDDVSLRLLGALPYIGKVTVVRKLPNTVVLKVSETTDYVGIPYRGGYLIVSGEMKILNDVYTAPVEMPLIYGITPTSFIPGSKLTAENPGSIEGLEAIIKQLNAYRWFDKISAINVRDKLDVSMVYDERIFVRIGSIGKIEGKFEMLNNLLRTKLAEDFTGNINLSTPGMAYESSGEMRFPQGFFDIGGAETTETA